jgi:hypothetical protein
MMAGEELFERDKRPEERQRVPGCSKIYLSTAVPCRWGSAPSARYLPGRLAGDPVSSWRRSYLASAADGDGDGDGSCHCPVSLAAAARCSRRPRSCASPPAILLFVRLCSAIAVPFFRLAIRTRVWPVSPVCTYSTPPLPILPALPTKPQRAQGGGPVTPPAGRQPGLAPSPVAVG